MPSDLTYIMALVLCVAASQVLGGCTFGVANDRFVINGTIPVQIKAGSIHYSITTLACTRTSGMTVSIASGRHGAQRHHELRAVELSYRRRNTADCALSAASLAVAGCN